MSSDENQEKVSETKGPRQLEWLDRFALQILMGVIMTITRVSLAVAVGLSIATLGPAVGLAEEPAAMKVVEDQIQEQEAEALPGDDEPGKVGKFFGALKQKTVAGAVAVRDGIWDPSEDLKQKKLELKEARRIIIKQREELAAARIKAGAENTSMLQCSIQVMEYLQGLESQVSFDHQPAGS